MANLFEKEDYDEEDIKQLIKDKVEESIKLDYKSAGSLDIVKDSKKKELTKDISGFANSAGGILIYGIKENNHFPDDFDFINGEKITKEWLEQTIHGNIHPKIDKLIIYPIRFDNKIEQSIYLIKVPETINSPHMAKDGRYYQRSNTQTIQMEEYQVKAAYNKHRNAILEILEPNTHLTQGRKEEGKIYDLNLTINLLIKNTGNMIEKLYKVEVYLPYNAYHIPGNVNNEKLKINHKRDTKKYSIFGFPNDSPLFPEEVDTIKLGRIKIDFNSVKAWLTQTFKIRLYYSGGVKELELNASEIFSFQNKEFSLDIFS